MNVIVISALTWLALAVPVAAQGAPSRKPATAAASTQPTAAPSQAQLSELRALAHELQARTEKLGDLLEQYSSLARQRPQAQAGNAGAKKAHDDQLAKWDAAVERLLRRVDGAHAAVVETLQRLDQLPNARLPTSLAKDVVRARNDAVTQRTAAEQVLAKNKAVLARPPKPAKSAPPPEDLGPSLPDDL